jgi:membrane protease subunit HflK
MPWSNQSGGGGWKGGGGGGGPWGQRPPSGGGGGGGGNSQQDLEEFLRRGQDRIRQALPGGMGGPFFGLAALAIAAIIAFFGFTVRVNPDELGVVLRFGEYVRQLPPGLNFRWPYPIEQVFVPQVTRVNRVEVGMRTTGDSRVIVENARDVPEESLMLTGDENIVDVDVVVFWQIKDAASFLFNIANPQVTVKEVAESAMREVVGQSKIEPILTQQRAKTETAVQQLMQKTLDEYGAGVLVRQVQLQKVDPPNQVIDAFRDVQAARADQERLQNEAQTYANRVIPEARGEAERILQAAQGYRDSTVAEARGQADRFSKVYEEYRQAPDVTRRRMYLETMERVFGDMDKVIIDDKGGQGQGVIPYLPLNELSRPRQPGAAVSPQSRSE